MAPAPSSVPPPNFFDGVTTSLQPGVTRFSSHSMLMSTISSTLKTYCGINKINRNNSHANLYSHYSQCGPFPLKKFLLYCGDCDPSQRSLDISVNNCRGLRIYVSLCCPADGLHPYLLIKSIYLPLTSHHASLKVLENPPEETIRH